MYKIYLAGPTVFLKNSDIVFKELTNLFSLNGFQAITPFESELNPFLKTKREVSSKIYQENLEKIHQCDAIVADLNPFRSEGFEPDSGTVFEVGYGYALKKPIIAVLTDQRPLRTKLSESLGEYETTRGFFDKKHDLLIEDFDNPVNLMLAHSTSIVNSYEEAVSLLKSTITKKGL